VASHFLFSTFQKSRIAYPTTAAEKRNLQQKSENVIEMLVAEMTPTARAFNSTSLLVSVTKFDQISEFDKIFTKHSSKE
jgi:hypothetical protein